MKIITHDGFFHADEVFAIALLHKVLGECPVVRTRELTQEDLVNPETWVLDVGRDYNVSLHNFDHHQDKLLSATNVLVLSYLYGNRLINLDLADEIREDFITISNIDTKGYFDVNGFQVNSLIRTLNHIPNGFNTALILAKAYLDGKIDAVYQIEKSKQIYDAGVVYDDVIVCEAFPIHWKRYNKHKFLVYPDKGKWYVQTIDSKKYPLETTGDEDFMHNERFLAVYTRKEFAFYAARCTSEFLRMGI